jgi:hypothetical protein
MSEEARAQEASAQDVTSECAGGALDASSATRAKFAGRAVEAFHWKQGGLEGALGTVFCLDSSNYRKETGDSKLHAGLSTRLQRGSVSYLWDIVTLGRFSGNS